MKKKFVMIGGVGIVLIIMSIASLLAYHTYTPNIGTLELAHSQQAIHEPPSTTHSRWFTPTPTPTVVTQKTPVVISTNVVFPACLQHNYVGWTYGWHGTTFEYGTDFDCTYRTPIPAVWSGKIVELERTCWNSSCSSTSGGLVVVAAMVPGLGLEDTYYLHLDEITSRLHLFDTVAKGTLIGWTGGQIGYGHWPTSPWFTSGPHLEMGFDWPYAKVHGDGINCNPLWYIERSING